MRLSRDNGDYARFVVVANSANDNVVATVKKFPFPCSPREFVVRQVGVVEDGTEDLLYCSHSVYLDVDYGTTYKSVRGAITGLVRFTKLGEEQCTVVLYQYADAGGVIPQRTASNLLPKHMLAVVEPAMALYRRNDEIDKAERDLLVAIIKNR